MANFSALKTAIQNAIKQNGNEEITGDVLQQILLSIVSTMGDGAINTIEQNLSNEMLARQGADNTLQQNIDAEALARGNADNTLQSHIDAEALTRGNADTQLQNAINAIKAYIDNGYVYAGIATPTTTPVSGKVFYIATAAGTYTNFGGQVLTQGINILRFNGSAWSSQQLIGIDDEPTAGSENLVKSGGVTNYITQFADKYVTSDIQGRCANFDTTNGTLTFARDSWVILKPNNGMRYPLPSTPITYYTLDTSLIFLMYDYQLQTLIFRKSGQTASNTELLLAVIRKNGYDIKEVNGCFNYTINNTTVFQRFYDKYVLCNRDYANFDTENGTLTFPSDSWVMINCENGKRYPLPTTPIEYNNSTLASSVVFLIYNYTTQTLVFKLSGQTVTNTEMLICVLKKDSQGTKIYEVSGCFNYTIDGVPFSEKQATYINTSINESIKNIQLYSTTLYSTRGVINKINVSKVATLSTSGGIQGCAIYGGVLFQAHDPGLISLFDINNDYQFISEYQSPLNVHMTNISFGNEKYDNNDEFPLLYVPQNGRTGYEVYVLRVSRQSSELVQTLSFPNNPNSVGYYPVSIVDSVNGYVYCWGYKRDNYSQEDNNEFIISKYLLPLLSEGNITLELIETFRVPYRGIGQGACCDGINLYFQCGIGQKPSYLQIISPFTKKEIGLLDCSEYHNAEPEGLTINANRLVSTYSDRSVYELSF